MKMLEKVVRSLGTNSIHRLQTDKTYGELIRVYRSVLLMKKIFCYVGLDIFYNPSESRFTDGRIRTALLIIQNQNNGSIRWWKEGYAIYWQLTFLIKASKSHLTTCITATQLPVASFAFVPSSIGKQVNDICLNLRN